MTPKVEINNSKLLERMKRYEAVTGKQIGATMRRGARLLAVNMATSTQPYGKNIEARKAGEKAVQNDILRVMRPMEKINLPIKTRVEPFKNSVQKFSNKELRKRLLKMIGEYDIAAFTSIVRNFSVSPRMNVLAEPDALLHKKTRNAYGRVRKGWKNRDIVFKSGYLEEYIKKKQPLVGMTKAAWAAAAFKVNADVKDALSGVPSWVKRHVDKMPSAVVDRAESMAPAITLTNKLPWADKALREADKKEAIRIARGKFYRAMGIEIRHALRSEKAS